MGKSFDLSLVLDFIPELLRYLHITLIVLGGSIVLGLVGGVLLAVPRLYRIPVLSQLATLYVSFMRGTPILIKLFLVYYGLPELLKPIGIDLSRTDPLLFVIVTYALSDAASFAEIFRGAVRSVDKGQTEAAYAAGMTTFQSFRRIVVPQALIVAFSEHGQYVNRFIEGYFFGLLHWCHGYGGQRADVNFGYIART